MAAHFTGAGCARFLVNRDWHADCILREEYENTSFHNHVILWIDCSLAVGANFPMADGLVIDFHEVPLRAVLDYLSNKAGLIVVSEADVKGAVTVTADQPVSTAEAVSLLNDQLIRNRFTAVLEGRTLRVIPAASTTDAQTPVLTLTNVAAIPVDNKIVTEILPVHTLNPVQLLKDLERLIPEGATVSANETGNAIIMTASQKDIRRLAAIITALDSTAVSEVNVFPLTNAGNLKAVAEELKRSSRSGDTDPSRSAPRITFGRQFGRPGGDGNSGGKAKEKTAPTKPVFVADEQMNAVAASAPPDYMPMIARVVGLLDKQGEDVTEVEIFTLQHADPAKSSKRLRHSLARLEEPGTRINRRGRWVSIGGPGQLSSPARASAASESSRLKRQGTVTAVADRRTRNPSWWPLPARRWRRLEK